MISPKVTAFKTLLAPKWLALICFLGITATNAEEVASDEATLRHLIKQHIAPLTHKPHLDTSHNSWEQPLVKTPPFKRVDQQTYKVASPQLLPSPLLIMARQRQSSFYPKKVQISKEDFPKALLISKALILPKVKQGIQINPTPATHYIPIQITFPSLVKYLPRPLCPCEPTSTSQKLEQKLSLPITHAQRTPTSITPIWQAVALTRRFLIPHRSSALSLPMYDAYQFKAVAQQPLPSLIAQPCFCHYLLRLMPLSPTESHGNYTALIAEPQQTVFPPVAHEVFPKPSYQDYLYYKVAPLFETTSMPIPYKTAYFKAPLEKRIFSYASLKQVSSAELLTSQTPSHRQSTHTPVFAEPHLKEAPIIFACDMPSMPTVRDQRSHLASIATCIRVQSHMTSDAIVVSHKLYPPLDELAITPLESVTVASTHTSSAKATWAAITPPSVYHTWEVFPAFYVESLSSSNTEATSSKAMLTLCSSLHCENTKFSLLEKAKANPHHIADQILVENNYKQASPFHHALAYSEKSLFPNSLLIPIAFNQPTTTLSPNLTYGAMALTCHHLDAVEGERIATNSVLQQAPCLSVNSISTHPAARMLAQVVSPSSEKVPLDHVPESSASYLTHEPSGAIPYALPALVSKHLARVTSSSSKLNISSYEAYHEFVLPKLEASSPSGNLILAFIPDDAICSLNLTRSMIERASFALPYLTHDQNLISEEIPFYTEFIDSDTHFPQKVLTCSLTAMSLPFEEPSMTPTAHTTISTQAREPIKAHTTYLSPETNTSSFALANTHSQSLIKTYSEGMLAQLDLPESFFLVYDADVRLSRKHHHKMYHQRQAIMAQLEKDLDYEVVTLNNHYNCDVNYAYNEEEDLYDFEILLSPKPKQHYPEVSQNFIFVVDNSALVNKQRYAGFKKGIVTSLNYLKPKDTAAVIVVDKEIFSVTKKPLLLTPTAKKNLAAQINALTYSGYYAKFDFADMMRAAQTQFIANKENVVVLLSDAHMFADIRTTHRFMKQFTEKSQDTFAVYTATCKSQRNLSNMRILAELHQGTLCYSPTVAAFPRNLAILVKHATSTISSNINISVDDGESSNTTLYPTMLSSTLFNDEPFKLYGSTNQLENFSIDIKAHGKHALISLPLYIDFDRAYLSNHLLPEAIEKQKAISSLHRSYFNDEPHFFESVETIVELNETPSTLVLK